MRMKSFERLALLKYPSKKNSVMYTKRYFALHRHKQTVKTMIINVTDLCDMDVYSNRDSFPVVQDDTAVIRFALSTYGLFNYMIHFMVRVNKRIRLHEKDRGQTRVSTNIKKVQDSIENSVLNNFPLPIIVKAESSIFVHTCISNFDILHDTSPLSSKGRIWYDRLLSLHYFKTDIEILN